MSRNDDTNNRTIATNRRARHDYEIEATWEAGLVLKGSEVKSLRDGAVTMGDGFVADVSGELFLQNVHIPEYTQANRLNHEPDRRRKLLLNRREIERIREAIEQKGRSCVPLKIYLKNGRFKVELGVGKGKKHHDRRQDIKKRDANREMARSLRR